MIGWKKCTGAAFLAAILALAVTGTARAHETGEEPGFEEELGRVVPLEATFRGEHGETVRLGGLLGRPTLLVFQYYRCRDACGLILTNLASTLGEVSAEPGRDYGVLTVSIDERETPQDAREKKALIASILGPGFPAGAWRFLTGDAAGIHALAEAAGFHFRREGEIFTHPVGLVVLSPQGTIVRYMLGDRFLAADLRLSMLEASTGTIGPTISRFVRFCFSVDPSGRGFTFNALKVTGVVTVAFAAAFVLLLVLRGRRSRSTGGKS